MASVLANVGRSGAGAKTGSAQVEQRRRCGPRCLLSGRAGSPALCWPGWPRRALCRALPVCAGHCRRLAALGPSLCACRSASLPPGFASWGVPPRPALGFRALWTACAARGHAGSGSGASLQRRRRCRLSPHAAPQALQAFPAFVPGTEAARHRLDAARHLFLAQHRRPVRRTFFSFFLLPIS